jgi:hypothetical protein
MGLRVYSVDGKKATFNKIAFNHLLKQKSRRDKISVSKLEQMLAEKLQTAVNTVHKWNYNGGGPSDYSMVVQLAEVLDTPDVALLLTFINEGENDMTHLTDRQLSAVKRIYDICIWFLHEFESSDGFNDYWNQFSQRGSSDPESKIEELADGMLAKVRLILDQEYFDLRECKIYDELCEFVSEDLLNTYDGKLSYAYRFEAIPDGNPTTSEDYDKAMIRLNTIIDKCK